MLKNAGRKKSGGDGDAGCQLRESPRTALLVRPACTSHRAHSAGRLASRSANRGPQFHQCLIQSGAPLVSQIALSMSRSNQLRRHFPKLPVERLGFGVTFQSKQPGQNSDDIPIQNGFRLIECDGGNGTRRVRTNPGKPQNSSRIPRENSSVIGHDLAGRSLKVASSGIIAQTFPEFQHQVCGGFGQISHGRQAFHPAIPIRDHRLNLSLLEHYLGNPNRIGITRPPPRQISGRPIKPPGQSLNDRGQLIVTTLKAAFDSCILAHTHLSEVAVPVGQERVLTRHPACEMGHRDP